MKAIIASGVEIHRFEEKLPTTDVIVDALLGIGLNREVSGDYALAVNAINEHTKRIPVLALDIPSGLHANTGRALGTACSCHNHIKLPGAEQRAIYRRRPQLLWPGLLRFAKSPICYL